MIVGWRRRVIDTAQTARVDIGPSLVLAEFRRNGIVTGAVPTFFATAALCDDVLASSSGPFTVTTQTANARTVAVVDARRCFARDRSYVSAGRSAGIAS